MTFRWMIISGLLWISAFAHADTLHAPRASKRAPYPSMKQTVHAFMRVAWSEAGPASPPDENIIHQAFESQTGQSMANGQLRNYMRQMAGYSNRTFPAGSPFVIAGYTARTPRQRWVSQIPYDCASQPADWPREAVGWFTRPRHQKTGERLASAQEACEALRKRTWRRFKGEEPNWCTGRVDHWGGSMDVDNPRNGKWVRVTCDRPDAVDECDELRREHPGKPFKLPSYCAKNIAWCVPGRGSCESDSGQSFATAS